MSSGRWKSDCRGAEIAALVQRRHRAPGDRAGIDAARQRPEGAGPSCFEPACHEGVSNLRRFEPQDEAPCEHQREPLDEASGLPFMGREVAEVVPQRYNCLVEAPIDASRSMRGISR